MKNELLKNIICSKEEELREKEKELKNIKYNLMCVKKDGLLMGYTIEEIKASIAFTEEYIKFIQEEIIVLKNMCDRYKKKYNLEEYKMKLSEFKDYIIKQFGEKEWWKYESTYGYSIYSATEEEQLDIVNSDEIDIKYINNPSEKLQLLAVRLNGYTIQHINNPSEKVQLEAIKKAQNSIKYINNPTEEVQLLAIKSSPYALQYIKNPTEKVQLEAVKGDGFVIEYIDNPSEKVQLEAVKEDGYAIKHIKNPSKKVIKEAVRSIDSSYVSNYLLRYIENDLKEGK